MREGEFLCGFIFSSFFEFVFDFLEVFEYFGEREVVKIGEVIYLRM